MKNIVLSVAAITLSIAMSGCGGASVNIPIEPVKKPLSVDLFVTTTSECNPNILASFGNANAKLGNKYIYNLAGDDIQDGSTVIVRNYYGNLMTIDTKINDLKFKSSNIKRDKYYFYVANLVKAKCDAKESGGYRGIGVGYGQSKSNYENETRHLEDATAQSKSKVQEYGEKLLLMKESMLEDGGQLPTWFKY